MSGQYQSQQNDREQIAEDPFTTAVGGVVKVVGLVLLAVVVLPLVVPGIAMTLLNFYGPTRARYWLVPRWWVTGLSAGLAAVVVLLGWEVWRVGVWVTTVPGGVRAGLLDWSELWPTVAPWLVVNLLAGVLLVPAAWALSRRRTARKVYARQINDVVRQEQIERARATAADWTAAKRIGVRMDPRTGKFASQRRAPRLVGPAAVKGVGTALGVVLRPTVRTWQERARDVRTAPDWVDAAGRWLVMPVIASACRALLIAESGTGKTVLLTLLIRAASAMGWPVVMIDAKGDPADAHTLAEALRAKGLAVAIGPKWNLFSGSAEQITERLMRLLPPGEGAARHYSDEARGVLGMIQELEPLRSVDDLAARLRDPRDHVRDEHDYARVVAVVDSRSGLTAAGRVWQSLAAALRPLTPYIDAAGWSYKKPGADVVVVPLTPVDTAQARVGDLLLMALRQHMADRLAAGDKSPALMIVDEFPQLVTADTDPGDVAAALFETSRSAGLGLILAGQSVAGLSADEAMRKRALSSGAALIVGRSKDPEDVVGLAGTVMRLEASGEASGAELRSGRAQHTYVIPPQEVREAWNGRFWLIHGGAIAPFRVLPPAPAGAAAVIDVEDVEQVAATDVESVPVAAAPERAEDAPAQEHPEGAGANVEDVEDVGPERPTLTPREASWPTAPTPGTGPEPAAVARPTPRGFSAPRKRGPSAER